MDIFTARDRCDRCPAQAQVGFTKGKGELMFCSHHGTRHELALVSAGWSIPAGADARPTLRAASVINA